MKILIQNGKVKYLPLEFLSHNSNFEDCFSVSPDLECKKRNISSDVLLTSKGVWNRTNIQGLFCQSQAKPTFETFLGPFVGEGGGVVGRPQTLRHQGLFRATSGCQAKSSSNQKVCPRIQVVVSTVQWSNRQSKAELSYL